MWVGFDLQPANGTATGIGEYARELAAALVAQGTELVPLKDARFDLWRFDRRVFWDQVVLPAVASRARIDLLHCTSGTIPLATRLPIVATLHDAAWQRVQHHTRWYARAYFGRIVASRARNVRRVVTVSEFSRREILAAMPLEPARVDVVDLGVARAIHEICRRPDERPMILAVGTVEPRKNLAVVIRALRELPSAELIAVGPTTPYRDECARIAADLGVAERVRFRGYVERDELLELYARAAIAVVPSRYEGFGLGAAQALCAGVPLVAADATSLPEVVGGAAPLVSPDDSAGWTEAIAAILEDRDAAERHASSVRPAAQRRFSWAACARGTRAVYERAFSDQ